MKLTQDAIEHLNQNLPERMEERILHIWFKKNGCAGYSTQMDWVDIDQLDSESNNLTVLFDENWNFGIAWCMELSEKLVGSVLDYRQVDSFNTKLTLDMPMVMSTCGCGESFGFA